MEGNNALQVIKTKQFNGINFDCYAQENDDNDFWATREQIGQLLGYENPRLSIANIHNRNKERLDKFSRVIKMITHEENREVTRDFRIYNFKGLLEICRYSNQPKADAVMDFIWEIADEIRKTGAYVPDKALMDPAFIRGLTERIAAIQQANDELREQIAKDQAATTFGKIMLGMPNGLDFHKAAQVFAQHGFPVGRNKLYQRCREKKWLCEQKKIRNQPTQAAIERGLVGWQPEFINGKCEMIVVLSQKALSLFADELTKEFTPIVYLIDREESKAQKKLEGKQRHKQKALKQ